MSRLTKYLGIHAPEGSSYQSGTLDAWANAFGANYMDTYGAPLAWKRRDSAGFWRGGLAASIPADKLTMFQENHAWGFQIFSQWITHTNDDPLDQSLWTSEEEANLLNAAAAVADLYPGVLLWNNRRGGSFGAAGTNTNADVDFYMRLVAKVAKVWEGAGRKWGYVDDNGPSAFLGDLRELERACDREGVWPTVAVYHAYGKSDWSPRHSRLYAEARTRLISRPLTLMGGEVHWWFVPDGDTRAQHADVFDNGAGAYCAAVCESNHDAGVLTALFTVDQFFNEAGTNLAASGRALAARATAGRWLDEPSMAGTRQQRLRSYAIRRQYMSRALARTLTLALG